MTFPADFDRQVREQIANSDEYIDFYRPFFSSRNETRKFLYKCLQKITTRRMMLRVVWYVDIADQMPKVKQGRPSLQIAFLISMAEQIARRRYTKTQANRLGSQKLVLDFYSYVTTSDKTLLESRVRRLLGPRPTSPLRFTSIIRILYDVRNRVFHGLDFWSFSLQKPQGRTNLITSGWLGKMNRKRRVSLDVSLKYKDLRDLTIRTAIENIKLLF